MESNDGDVKGQLGTISPKLLKAGDNEKYGSSIGIIRSYWYRLCSAKSVSTLARFNFSPDLRYACKSQPSNHPSQLQAELLKDVQSAKRATNRLSYDLTQLHDTSVPSSMPLLKRGFAWLLFGGLDWTKYPKWTRHDNAPC